MTSPAKRENPWRMISRNSRRAGALVRALDDAGVTLRGEPVTARKIEKLSGDGFVPDGASGDEVVAVVRILDDLGYGPGKSADETSLRLLTRGIAVERARKVLAASAPDLTQFTGDAIPSEVTDALDATAGPMAVIAPLLKRVFGALDDAPAGGRIDYAGVQLDETPEARREDFVDDAWRTVGGQPIANPELIYDVAYHPAGPFEPDDKHYERVAQPEEVAVVEEVAEQLGAAFATYPEVVASAPIGVLAQGAAMARAMLASVPADAVPGFDERSRDVLAAWLAPIMVGMVQAGWHPHPHNAAAFSALDELAQDR